MTKYRNQKVEYAGHVFDSLKERDRYIELDLLQKVGRIFNLKLQPKYELLPAQKGERAITYIADFAYDEKYWTSDPPPREVYRRVVEDVKSKPTRTESYVIKRKLFKSKYDWIEFREVL